MRHTRQHSRASARPVRPASRYVHRPVPGTVEHNEATVRIPALVARRYIEKS